MRKQCVTYKEAIPVRKQHESPCHDCPWARAALAGWLGDSNVGEWLAIAHGDGKIECHACQLPDGTPLECAGAAIYRSNVCKTPGPGNLDLPADPARVFARPLEFAHHHSRGELDTNEKVQMATMQGRFALIEKQDPIQVLQRRKNELSHSKWLKVSWTPQRQKELDEVTAQLRQLKAARTCGRKTVRAKSRRTPPARGHAGT